MPYNDPTVISEIERRRSITTSQRVAGAATELLGWYCELPLRRVRKLVELPQGWHDQRDYPPIDEIIDMYEAFLRMTSGQEEDAAYTLDLVEVGIPSLYVVESYAYAEHRSNMMIRESRWYHLFTSPSLYLKETGRDPHQDIGRPLEVHPHDPAKFSIDGFVMRLSEREQRASYYRKVWYPVASATEEVIRQEQYVRRANRLERERFC